MENVDATGQKTTTVAKNWAPGAKGYDLKFHRVDNSFSEGASCQTAVDAIITLSGAFRAVVYISSNVTNSDGIFSISIINKAYSEATQLDLMMVNKEDNIVKSGQPQYAKPLDLKPLLDRWITVRVSKIGNHCSTGFIADNGSIIYDTG
jgi:hypothetical protein